MVRALPRSRFTPPQCVSGGTWPLTCRFLTAAGGKAGPTLEDVGRQRQAFLAEAETVALGRHHREAAEILRRARRLASA